MRVLVFGTFDLLHPGHLFFLAEARKRGELFVVVARDRNVQRIKGRFPIDDEDQRMAKISAAMPDAHAMLGDANDFTVPLRAIDPDLILLGYDQGLPPGVEQKDLPCEVERLPSFMPEVHKSSIIRKQKGL